MTKIVLKTAILTLGLGLLSFVPVANAQSSQPAPSVANSEGSHIETRARGRVGGGGYGYRGGSRNYGGGYGRGGYGRGGYIAGGVVAGIAGAIILNEVARSSRPTYYYRDGGLSCPQLEARCDSGQDWACRRLDQDPGC